MRDTREHLSRQHRNQRERRARKQADHVLTGIVRAIGAGELIDWLPNEEKAPRDNGEANENK